MKSWPVVLAALAACSAYDAALLDPLDDAPPASGSGGGGTGVVPDAGGGTGGSHPDGQSCGDGFVGSNEKCDTSIAAGLDGACPSRDDCLASVCPARDLLGVGCDAECVDLPVPCGSADDCCGRSCTATNDPDCSLDCGNGVVDGAMGETCEPSSVNDCPTDCDDADPCTADAMYGRRETCNVVCEHRPIVRIASGDDCCPPDGAPDTDDDCAPATP